MYFSCPRLSKQQLFQTDDAPTLFLTIMITAANLLLIGLLFTFPFSLQALGQGEIIALKDMQTEWGTQLGWVGNPSCSWKGITCDANGNVTFLCVSSSSLSPSRPLSN